MSLLEMSSIHILLCPTECMKSPSRPLGAHLLTNRLRRLVLSIGLVSLGTLVPICIIVLREALVNLAGTREFSGRVRESTGRKTEGGDTVHRPRRSRRRGRKESKCHFAGMERRRPFQQTRIPAGRHSCNPLVLCELCALKERSERAVRICTYRFCSRTAATRRHARGSRDGS
jgi:hypothetical protein